LPLFFRFFAFTICFAACMICSAYPKVAYVYCTPDCKKISRKSSEYYLFTTSVFCNAFIIAIGLDLLMCQTDVKPDS